MIFKVGKGKKMIREIVPKTIVPQSTLKEVAN